MKLNLGKNTTKILLILISLQISLIANVKLNAPKSFYSTEQVIFSITASGQDVKFPQITSIDKLPVQNAGTSSSTSIINGVRSQKITRSFAFRPTKTVTIPPFDIKIDGRIVKTKATTIEAKKIEKTISNDYELKIELLKKDIYVGEDTVLKLTFKYKKDLPIVDLQFVKPSFENFWLKELKSNNNQGTNGDFTTQELHYLLFPQKSGKLTLNPLKIGVVLMDSRYSNYGFFNQNATKTIPVYSNSIELNVKPLPTNVNLIGDFKITSTIDKTSINQGEAVSYKIQIKGRGNIDDIDEIKLDIQNTTIYDNPSAKDFNLIDGKYGGTYSKTYSIVASNDFTIPQITLKYFDKITNNIKTTKTKEYKIKVNGEVKQKAQLQVSNTQNTPEDIENEKIVTKVIETTNNEKIIFFILGVVFTIIILSIYILVKHRKIDTKKETPLNKKIKSVKSKVELLNLLVVYINIDNELDKIIFDLENKNSTSDLKLIKKDIFRILKDKKLEIQ